MAGFLWFVLSSGFQPPLASMQSSRASRPGLTPRMEADGWSRRDTTTFALAALGYPAIARADGYAYQPALAGKDYGKSEMGGGSDFTKTPSGLSYKDGTVGKGRTPAPGDRVVIDWTGYTVRGPRPERPSKIRSPEVWAAPVSDWVLRTAVRDEEAARAAGRREGLSPLRHRAEVDDPGAGGGTGDVRLLQHN